MSQLLILLSFCLLFSCFNKGLEIPWHPFHQHVPVQFGSSLEECQSIFKLDSIIDYYGFPHYQIGIDSMNSVFSDDKLALVGLYILGFDDGKLRKIIFQGAGIKGISRGGKLSLRSNDDYFKKVVNLSCEHFINCDDFKIHRTLDEEKWENLSTPEYNIDFGWKGKHQFYYIVERRN